MSDQKVEDVSLKTKTPEQKVEEVSSRIQKKLARLSRTSFKRSIFRLDDLLLKVNEKEAIGPYDPVMVAIGPYHDHGKDHLKMMEEHKLRYLQQLLDQRKESDVYKYVMRLTEREDEARSFYAERPEKDDFVEMMLLDGFFIIELFRKAREPGLANEDDLIFKMDRMLNVVQRDILLFENQMPFFILIDLFDMTKLPGGQDQLGIGKMALHFLGNRLLYPFNDPTIREAVPLNLQVDHLLGLVHHIYTRSYADKMTHRNQEDKVPFIGCNIKLQRAGIRFRSSPELSMFDIEFKDGAIRIPPLKVNDETEWFFRNLIAYEQYHQNLGRNCFTDSAKLMDCLVNSPEDVEQLRDRQIIENRLGCDAAMSDMFNKLCRNVTFNSKTFCYSSLFEVVNE